MKILAGGMKMTGLSDENAVRTMLMMAAMNRKIDAIIRVLNIVPDPNIGKPRGTTNENAIKLQNRITK